MIITTKADKIAITKVEAAVENIKKSMDIIKNEDILPFSTQRKIYLSDIWSKIEGILEN